MQASAGTLPKVPRSSQPLKPRRATVGSREADRPWSSGLARRRRGDLLLRRRARRWSADESRRAAAASAGSQQRSPNSFKRRDSSTCTPTACSGAATCSNCRAAGTSILARPLRRAGRARLLRLPGLRRGRPSGQNTFYPTSPTSPSPAVSPAPLGSTETAPSTAAPAFLISPHRSRPRIRQA